MKIWLFFNLDIFSCPPAQVVSGISYKEALGKVFSFDVGKWDFKGTNHKWRSLSLVITSLCCEHECRDSKDLNTNKYYEGQFTPKTGRVNIKEDLHW